MVHFDDKLNKGPKTSLGGASLPRRAAIHPDAEEGTFRVVKGAKGPVSIYNSAPTAVQEKDTDTGVRRGLEGSDGKVISFTTAAKTLTSLHGRLADAPGTPFMVNGVLVGATKPGQESDAALVSALRAKTKAA